MNVKNEKLVRSHDLLRDFFQAIICNKKNSNNFIVTGLPRSGTKFLAEVIQKSTELKAFHDRSAWMFYQRKKSGASEGNKYIRLINKRLQKSNYGEICGGFRLHLEMYAVRHKFLIIRDPHQVWLSHANMNGPESLQHSDLSANLARIEKLRYQCDRTIAFSKMTSSHRYLQQVLIDLGAEHVNIPQKLIEKKVNSRKIKYETINELPSWLRAKIIEESNYFREQWMSEDIL